MKKQYKNFHLPAIKIALTGTGRVATGAMEVLKLANVKQVSPQDFLTKKFDEAVFTQLTSEDLYERKSDKGYNRIEFHTFPEDYQSKFLPYAKVTDLMINAIYWDPKAPRFFSKEDMKSKDFKIKVIADITCDINGSIPSTLKATTIQDPVYGYNPVTESIEKPFQPHTIDVMAVDNLPNELPRDASEKFGTKIMKHVIEKLLDGKNMMLAKATICREGKLTPAFEYLNDFVAEKVG
jgi:alanine dehydrogenase